MLDLEEEYRSGTGHRQNRSAEELLAGEVHEEGRQGAIEDDRVVARGNGVAEHVFASRTFSTVCGPIVTWSL